MTTSAQIPVLTQARESFHSTSCPKYFSLVGWPNRAFPLLDETGRRLFLRSCDLVARLWLNDTTLPEFNAKNFEGCTMLVHAERYLADRLAYELAPWPKGKIKMEPEDAYGLPERKGQSA